MARNKKKNRTLEIRITIDGLDIVAAPNTKSADLDRLLEKRGAASFVFIPLAKPGKSRRSIAKSAAKARKKAELSSGDWYDGEMRISDQANPVPGVFAFDIRRHRAREIVEKLGVKEFFWGTTGAPVEQHSAKIFDDDASFDWKTVRSRSFSGLSDALSTAGNMGELPTAVLESQTTMQKFWQLVALVLGVSVAAGLIQALAFALLGASGATAWLASIIKVLLYPAVAPAILVGIYLRVLVRRGEEQARDFTAAEAEENWTKVAPHLLALWALCWVAVMLLTLVQSVPSADLPFLGRTNGVTTSLIICVWMLLPIAHARNNEALFGSGFEAGIAAAVSIFTIKISLYVTDQITNAMWGFLAGILPWVIPERLMDVINFFINIGAEIFFVAVLLGYAWSRTRQQFMRL